MQTGENSTWCYCFLFPSFDRCTCICAVHYDVIFNDTYHVKKILKWEHGRVMEHVTPYVLYGLLEMYGGYPHKQKSKEM